MTPLPQSPDELRAYVFDLFAADIVDGGNRTERARHIVKARPHIPSTTLARIMGDEAGAFLDTKEGR